MKVNTAITLFSLTASLSTFHRHSYLLFAVVDSLSNKPQKLEFLVFFLYQKVKEDFWEQWKRGLST